MKVQSLATTLLRPFSRFRQHRAGQRASAGSICHSKCYMSGAQSLGNKIADLHCIRPEGLLDDAERDLLAIAKFC